MAVWHEWTARRHQAVFACGTDGAVVADTTRCTATSTRIPARGLRTRRALDIARQARRAMGDLGSDCALYGTARWYWDGT
jgi:hypothetical protein